MNLQSPPVPKRDRRHSDLRIAIGFAVVMLLIPLGARIAAGLDWVEAADVSQRALMVLLGAFLVSTGNTIPKRLTPLARPCADPARVQAFHRFAGWVWVLTGLALGLAWIVLTRAAAGTVTVTIIPSAMAMCMIALWWLVRSSRRPAASR